MSARSSMSMMWFRSMSASFRLFSANADASTPCVLKLVSEPSDTTSWSYSATIFSPSGRSSTTLLFLTSMDSTPAS